METSLNPQQQQRIAKLNLLVLGDDYEKNQDIQCSFQNQQWGRSVQTQTFLREKLSQRYKLKRKSQRQSRIKPTFRESFQEKSKLTDKQSLKEILRKLDSKEMGTSSEQNVSKNILSQNYRFSRQKQVKEKYSSNKTTIDYQSYQDRSYRKVLCQSVNKAENNFTSKKMQIMSVKKIGKTQDESYMSIQGPFMQLTAQNFGKKRQFFTQCKHTRRFKNRIRKNTQNKENEAAEFSENPIELLRGADDLKKRLFTGNNSRNKANVMQSEEINKRTFHILQEINRTKSINLGKSMNFGKKFEGQSIKLKKSQLVPYSKLLKQRSNCMSKQKRSQSKVFMQSKDNIWVKLQIRG